MWGLIDEYIRRGPRNDYGISSKLGQYLIKYYNELADFDEDPIYVKNIMIIASRVPSCFESLQEFNLEHVQKIMSNNDIDSAFKAELGFAAAKKYESSN